jgi:myo-inositol 2-dehydrogenase / D-chiro-inositol 1-dehydrogenase
MTLRIGLIGAGMMGRCHARTLARQVKGAILQSVFDPSAENIERLRVEVQPFKLCATPEALIESDDIDAVIIASPDNTHAPLTMICIAHGKPVLCEKPLAETIEACANVHKAELSVGHQLVQVGFMRRFDPAYRQLKVAIETGEIGQLRFVRCIHRNRQAPGFFTDEMSITNAMIHEFDILHWLTGGEPESVSVATPRASQLEKDPVIATVRLSNGILAEIEVYMNAGYGYDIRTELLGSSGVLEMARAPTALVGRNGYFRADQCADFTERFADAYRIMLSGWVAAITTGTVARDAATSLDGLRAVAAARASVSALRSGQWEKVPARQFPDGRLFKARLSENLSQ